MCEYKLTVSYCFIFIVLYMNGLILTLLILKRKI